MASEQLRRGGQAEASSDLGFAQALTNVEWCDHSRRQHRHALGPRHPSPAFVATRTTALATSDSRHHALAPGAVRRTQDTETSPATMRQSPPAKGKNRGKPSSTGSPSPESVVADGFMRMDVRQAKHEMAQTGEGPHPQGLPLAELVAAQTSSALGRLWLRRSAEERQRWEEAAAKCETGQKWEEAAAKCETGQERYRDGFHFFSESLRERRSFLDRKLVPPPGPADRKRLWVRSSGQVAARTRPDKRNHPGTGLDSMPRPTRVLWEVNGGFVPYPKAAEAAEAAEATEAAELRAASAAASATFRRRASSWTPGPS